MKILILNGVNLNQLGKREPEIYGIFNEAQLNSFCLEHARNLNIHVDIKQSNIEGEIVNFIHDADGKYEGIVLNAGAYSHYSYAIADAIRSISIPVVEVHLTNIFSREDFRTQSVLSKSCVGVISGLNLQSYSLALSYFHSLKS